MKKIVIAALILGVIVTLILAKPWHRNNLALYASVNSDVLALTCGTIQEAQDAKALGVRRFAVNVELVEGSLMVLDAKENVSSTFQAYFDLAGYDMDLIWLNIRNLSAENSTQVYDIINSMDIMQEHTLIESASPEGMAVFERNGWHTIYTVHEEDVLAAISEELAKYNISGVCYPPEMDEYIRSWLVDINYYGRTAFHGNLNVYPHFLGIRVTLAK